MLADRFVLAARPTVTALAMAALSGTGIADARPPIDGNPMTARIHAEAAAGDETGASGPRLVCGPRRSHGHMIPPACVCDPGDDASEHGGAADRPAQEDERTD